MNTIRFKQDLSKQDFRQMVLEDSKMAIVKCKTTWSGSSMLVTPMFNELSKQYGDLINFFIIDAEKNKKVIEEYGVRELPHFLFFAKGALVDQVIGTSSKSVIEEKLKKLILENKK